MAKSTTAKIHHDESSEYESEYETEPAKVFHRRLSTQNYVKSTVSIIIIFCKCHFFNCHVWNH